MARTDGFQKEQELKKMLWLLDEPYNKYGSRYFEMTLRGNWDEEQGVNKNKKKKMGKKKILESTI